MFTLNDDMSIYATRGDTVFFTVTATDGNGENYKFKPDDVVRFKAFEKKACENVVSQKDFVITEETEEVNIFLSEDETRFGKIINKPRDYWYEVELNPYTNPQTIIGYDDDGPKVFRLYPESKNLVDDIPEEELSMIDDELSPTSTRPVQNQAVTRAMSNLSKHVDEKLNDVQSKEVTAGEVTKLGFWLEKDGKEYVTSETDKLKENTNKVPALRTDVDQLKGETSRLKSDFTEHTHTAEDVGAMRSETLLLNGTSLAEYLDACENSSKNGVSNGVVAYSNAPDAPSDISSGFLLYLRNYSLTSGYHLVAFFNGTMRVGYYYRGSNIVWVKGLSVTGSYTGNGSATTRTIDTGVLSHELIITSGDVMLHVTPSGAIAKNGTNVYAFSMNSINFFNGILTISSNDLLFNGNNYTYYYSAK